MVDVFGAKAQTAYQTEQLVKGVLASEGSVTAWDVGAYISFAAEILRIQRKHPGGAQLNSEVAILLARYKAEGLSEAVLIRCRNEVFTIPAPAAP